MNPNNITTGAGSPYNPNYNYQGAYQNAVSGYNQASGNTQAAQQNLSAYQKNMVDPSQMYGQDLTNAQSMYGFDPKALMAANQNLARTQTVMANLPQAVQQQGAYYGTTAGSEANNYAQQEGNLQPVLAGQTNAVNAYQNILAATQQQANQQATLGYQGEQLNVQALQNLVANALGYQGQQQQQEGVAQGEQSGYGTYLNALKQAQAAQESASAQMVQAQVAQSAQQQQLNEQPTQEAYLNAMIKAAQQHATAPGSNPASNPSMAYTLPSMAAGGGIGSTLGTLAGPFGPLLGGVTGQYLGQTLAPTLQNYMNNPQNQITGGMKGLEQALQGLGSYF